MSWAQRRKATYTLGFLSIILVIAVIIAFSLFNKKPTCFDGIQNQGETGIDCGGPCSILCRADYVNPSVLWTRWNQIANSGSYDFLVYAENPNIGVGAADAPYAFKIYDANNILLYSATGTADIPANNAFVVFESGININDKVPVRVDFAFSGDITWQKMPDLEEGISVISPTLIDASTTPKVLATLQNTTLDPMSNIQSVAILYDQNDNAIAFSKTLTDSLAPGGTAGIVFTWPAPFAAPVYKTDIISQILSH